MKFDEFLRDQQPALPTYLSLGETSIGIEADPVNYPHGYKLNVTTGDERLDRMITDPAHGGLHSGINWLLLCRMFREGVKVFRFKADTLEAMENYDLNVPAADYHQPFPTLVLDLPEDFCTRRQVPFTTLDGGTWPSRPQFMIMHKVPDQPILCLLIAFENNIGNIAYVVKLDVAETLEDCWVKNQNSPRLNAAEQAVSNSLIKAGLNACLLATHFGVTAGQPGNFQQHGALMGRLRQAKRRKQVAKVKEYQARLQAVPWVYTIAQEVAIYRKESAGGSHEGEPTGRHVHPHWRRGHWRNQPFGAGLKQTKRIPIPAVLVNGHRLLGGDTSHTSYTAKE